MVAAAFRSIVAATAHFFVVASICSAQTGAPIERPQVKPGDSWTYRRMDYLTNEPTGTYALRVTHADARAISAVVIDTRQKTEYDVIYTAEWNVGVSSTSVRTGDRYLYKFPLRVGATYKADWENENVRSGVRTRHVRTVRVVGWEEVIVPAGKFRALKIEAEGYWERLDVSGSSTARNVIWYVPEVKRWVKEIVESRTTMGYVEKTGAELVEFKLQ
jgi:hypothetical protein